MFSLGIPFSIHFSLIPGRSLLTPSMFIISKMHQKHLSKSIKRIRRIFPFVNPTSDFLKRSKGQVVFLHSEIDVSLFQNKKWKQTTPSKQDLRWMSQVVFHIIIKTALKMMGFGHVSSTINPFFNPFWSFFLVMCCFFQGGYFHTYLYKYISYMANLHF